MRRRDGEAAIETNAALNGSSMPATFRGEWYRRQDTLDVYFRMNFPADCGTSILRVMLSSRGHSVEPLDLTHRCLLACDSRLAHGLCQDESAPH